MSYAILRVEKCKSWGHVKAMADEHLRQGDFPHVDVSRSERNRVLVGSADPTADLRRYIEAAGAKVCTQGHRASVLALDLVLAMPPEWAGSASEAQQEAWISSTQAWLAKTFGAANVISSVLHLDETTPHVQAIVCPLDTTPRAKGSSVRLNAARWLDGKAKLAALQDSYAESVSHLGLERGIRGSKAVHWRPRKSGAELEQALADAQGQNLKAPVVPEPPTLLLPSSRSLFREDLQERLDDVIAQANSHMAAAAKACAEAQVKVRQSEARVKAMERTAAALAEETKGYRDIPLADVARALGLEPTPKKGKNMWGPGPISIDGQRFYDFGERKGGGGAIDLVMHLRQSSFADARAWLRDVMGSEAATRATVAKRVTEAKADVVEAKKEPFRLPYRDTDGVALQRVRKWLVRRGLDPQTFELAIADGRIYPTELSGHTNAVFCARKGSRSAEISGIGNESYKRLAARSEPTSAPVFELRVGSGDALVLAESAVKALAYAQLHPNGPASIVSVAGARPRLQWLDEMHRQGRKIHIAYDNDMAGDEAAEQLLARYPGATRVKPAGVKDWDDLLPKPRPAPSPERDEETLEEQNARFRREWAELDAKRQAEELARRTAAEIEQQRLWHKSRSSGGPSPR